MMKTRMIVLAALAAFAAGSALAADATLLGLVPPDAKVVAGVRVSTAKASPFGQFVLSRLHPESQQAFDKLIAATGFDPRRDVSEIILASPAPGTHDQGIVALRGVFDPALIQSAATAHGCTISTVMGVTMFTAGDAFNGALALPDATTAMLGDVASVKAAIARYRSKTKPADDLQTKVQAASLDASGTANDFWFVTLVPLSEFAPKAPADSTSAAPQMTALQTVQQASGGVRFTADNVRLAAQLVMRSDKDAQSMADVIRFMVTMFQSNRQKNQSAGTMASLLDTMTISTTTNVTQVALVLPEAQVEQLVNTLQQHGHAENRAPQAN
jgi:hypothetical protein